ncbi:hypothetical protein DFP94_109126 [Fontibacillus phaseoli]|uniref:Uncharacterized protein n=1 Tax=Fontibacillus phaseoli TaxID=1416533 RepID=A0A369B7A2_9BACL|nr:hypothetical protein DFP94_109126 [Fontibacillus phaseoli]
MAVQILAVRRFISAPLFLFMASLPSFELFQWGTKGAVICVLSLDKLPYIVGYCPIKRIASIRR